MGDRNLTEIIIAGIIKVHQTLGPGFRERVYRRALTLELRHRGLQVQREKRVTIFYNNRKVGYHRLDLFVENRIIIELKTVDTLNKRHYAQLRSYLKSTQMKIGLLVNFAGELADYRRVETKN